MTPQARLRASVAIFATWGGVLALAGGLGAGMVASVMGPRFVFMSGPADAAFFGQRVTQLYQADPALRDATSIYMTMLSATLGSLGIAVAALAWFGLRRGSRGALVCLGLIPIPIVAWFLVVRASYGARGVTIGLADVPPFVWATAVVALTGCVVGWSAVRPEPHGRPTQ